MFGFALNHLTVAKASYAELLATAEALQFVGGGVEATAHHQEISATQRVGI